MALVQAGIQDLGINIELGARLRGHDGARTFAELPYFGEYRIVAISKPRQNGRSNCDVLF